MVAGSRRALTAGFATLLSASLAAVVAGQSLEDLERAKTGVVMVETQLPDGKAFGAGFVLSVKHPEAWIVTANHLVRRRGVATSIKVQFHGRRGEWADAVLLDVLDPDLDLAVIRVDLPARIDAETLSRIPAGVSFLPKSADVYPLGYPGGSYPWDMPATPDKVLETQSLRVRFQTRFVRPGSSGGPLLDACGRIIGMVITKEDSVEAQAVRIELIMDAARGWSLPAPALQYSSGACGAATTDANADSPRWRTHNFPAPNGGSVAFAIMPDGNPACASYNGGGCLWGVPLEKIEFTKLQPLVCGEGHRARWGVTGYEDPKHWCSLARDLK